MATQRRNPAASKQKLPERPNRPTRRSTDDLASALRFEVYTIDIADPELQRELDQESFDTALAERVYRFTQPETGDEASFAVVIGPMTARHCLDYKSLTGGRDLPADLEMLIRWQAIMNKSQVSARALEKLIQDPDAPQPPIRPIFTHEPTTPEEQAEMDEANAAHDLALQDYMRATSAKLTAIIKETDPDLSWEACTQVGKELSRDDETGEIRLLLAERPFNGSIAEHANYICAYMLSRYGRVHHCTALQSTSLRGLGMSDPTTSEDGRMSGLEDITPDHVLDVAPPDLAFGAVLSPHHLDEDGQPAEMSLFLYLLERTGLWTHQKMSDALGVPIKKAMGEGQEFGLTRSSVKLP